jgi:maltose alpha-D-glucosyltransferase/alpha-amylase
LSADTLWYKDAVFYELHVKAFQDSSQDGVGDFGGLIQRLDYVAGLGVDVIWLLPFYPSPLRDDGYQFWLSQIAQTPPRIMAASPPAPNQIP